jgi:ATPase subunit of ABC transporter with duplicated ATPase domains
MDEASLSSRSSGLPGEGGAGKRTAADVLAASHRKEKERMRKLYLTMGLGSQGAACPTVEQRAAVAHTVVNVERLLETHLSQVQGEEKDEEKDEEEKAEEKAEE